LINGRVVNFWSDDSRELLFFIRVCFRQHSTIAKDTLKVFALSEGTAIKIAKKNIRVIYSLRDSDRISIVSIQKIFNPEPRDSQLEFIEGAQKSKLKFFPDSH